MQYQNENNQAQEKLEEDLELLNQDKSLEERFYLLKGSTLKYLTIGSAVVGAFLARAFLNIRL